jgi:peptidoglycan/xylan/chitin deacetylase (PgdA/CDA1 family)
MQIFTHPVDNLTHILILIANWFRIADFTLFFRKRSLILMYHSIDGEDAHYRYEIPLSGFVNQIEYIRRKFQVVPLDQIYSHSKSRKCQVTLTFDDAYDDFYTNVYPLLLKYDLPATVFVPTAFIDVEPGSSDQDRHLFGKKHVSWDQLREMHASGLVEIGSHTHDHINCTEDFSRFEVDVQLSRQILIEQIGVQPRYFAYPYGLRSKETDQTLQRLGFEFAVMSRSQIINGQFVRGRVDIYQRNHQMPYFKLTLAGFINTGSKEIYRTVKQKLHYKKPAPAK